MFPVEYQHELLLKMTDPAFMRKVGSLVDARYFNPEFETVINRIKAAWKKQQVLNRTQLRHLLSRQKLKLKAVTNGSFAFDRDEFLQFAQERVVRDAVYRVVSLCEKGRFDECFEVFARSQRDMPQAANTAASVDVLQSLGGLPVRQKLIPTGFAPLDTALQGGVAAGDLAAVLAPTSGGKTSWLCAVSVNALLQGKRVFYVTLEVPHTEIEVKVRRCLTQQANPSAAKWAKTAACVRRKGGALRVVEHAPYMLNPSELERELQDVDLFVVDYADYLKPPRGGKEGLEYYQLGEIYGSLKRIAMSRKISVWTASQVNRAAYDNPTINLSDVESSLKKVMVVDQAIGLQIQQGTVDKVSFQVAKNRHGPRFQVLRATVDWATTTFREGTIANGK